MDVKLNCFGEYLNFMGKEVKFSIEQLKVLGEQVTFSDELLSLKCEEIRIRMGYSNILDTNHRSLFSLLIYLH